MLNMHQVKDVHQAVTGFVLGTLMFMAEESRMLSDTEIKESWHAIWIEYLASKTKS